LKEKNEILDGKPLSLLLSTTNVTFTTLGLNSVLCVGTGIHLNYIQKLPVVPH
jgi:hypothetical protein